MFRSNIKFFLAFFLATMLFAVVQAYAVWQDAPAAPAQYGTAPGATQDDYKPVNLGSFPQAKLGGFTIGTSTPLSTDMFQIESPTANAGIVFSRGGTIVGGILANTVNQLNIQSFNQPIRFSTNGFTDEHMRIALTGNVGIGTVSPYAKLQIDMKDLQTTEGLYISSDNTSANHYSYLNIEDMSSGSAVPIFKVHQSGNVGIGTTTPAYKLGVDGNISGTQLCIAGDCKSSWSSVVSSNTPDLQAVTDVGTSTTNVIGASGFYDAQDNNYYIDPNATGYSAVLRSNVTVGGTLDAVTLKENGVAVQRRGTTTSCSSGQFITSIGANGDVSCANDQTGSPGSGTQNYIAKWTSGSALGDSVIYEDAAGKVGIGTVSPAGALDVAYTINNTNFATRISNTVSTGYGLLIDAASGNQEALRVRNYNGTSELFAVDGDGKVGIGTIAPTSRLTIAGGAGSSLEFSGASGAYDIQATHGGGLYIYNTANNFIKFGTNDAERMQINGAGRVGIGMQPDDVDRLTVNGAISATGLKSAGDITVGNSVIRDWILRADENFDSDLWSGWYSFPDDDQYDGKILNYPTNVATLPNAFPLSDSDRTTCGANIILGGYRSGNRFGWGSFIWKFYDLSSTPHSEVRLTAKYYAIDSWDREEAFVEIVPSPINEPPYFIRSTTARWAALPRGASSSTNICGVAGYMDNTYDIDLRMHSSEDYIYLLVGANLSGSYGDENYGIDNVQIWVR